MGIIGFIIFGIDVGGCLMGAFIRGMTKEDVERVQDIARESWHATYKGIIPREIQDNFLRVAYSDEMMETRLRSSNLYVAECGNEVVGFADFSLADSEGKSELRAIYLYTAHQGKGIGSALLQKGIEGFENGKELIVEVEKDNLVGVKFYKAKGFKLIAEYDDDFDGHILRTIQMVLIL